MDIATPSRIPSHPPFIDRELLARIMGLDDYLHAVEAAFRAHANCRTAQPMPLHIELDGGGFHAKGAYVGLRHDYVAVKVNSNFPGNPARGLPTIQGAVLLYDASDGRLLAILDSMEITSKRTAAASALAARHLARPEASTIAICGCGEQGRAQLAAIARVRPLEHAHAWDADPARAREFAAQMSRALGMEVFDVADLHEATASCDIIVTATTARTPFLARECVRPGTFIAAIGADNPHKSELHPELFAGTKVVVDSLEQAAAMGDLHHALANPCEGAGSLVHAELAEIVANRKPGRTNDDEITIFDSTGLAIQDVASAALAYESWARRLDSSCRRRPRSIAAKAGWASASPW
ncbi:MAG TPA: ornithine cyclodeaminase family protein [Usitatibacter sp.]|nr:ornithine cyclodeaminase family protein [Usitatibacter sp.]HET9651661.1 ornithine cyclodeaminase family protein [Usitatibacter sp.]